MPPPDEPAIALVVGYDRRLEDVKTGNPSRSDTLMLVRADPTTDSISMLSFPRDLHVEIHCPGRGTFGDRINQAYAVVRARRARSRPSSSSPASTSTT